MPIFYPSWVEETLVQDRVLELKAFNPLDDGSIQFRIEVFLSEATDLYLARCFRRRALPQENMWELLGESSGHGNAEEAVQQFVNRIDGQFQQDCVR